MSKIEETIGIDELIKWASRGLLAEIEKKEHLLGMAIAWGEIGHDKEKPRNKIQELRNKLQELKEYYE